MTATARASDVTLRLDPAGVIALASRQERRQAEQATHGMSELQESPASRMTLR